METRAQLGLELGATSLPRIRVAPFHRPLLKWIGSKQRVAPQIIAHLPTDYGTYFEPFLGSGGVLGTLAPRRAVASDSFKPLILIWQTLRDKPAELKGWYAQRWHAATLGEKVAAYEQIKESYNKNPNAADLLFLSRACYGGVVRFRRDGFMSTPCGVHNPITPDRFAKRVDEWHVKVRGTTFLHLEYADAIGQAQENDLIYCDPPYSHSQSILYGAQSFSLPNLFSSIASAKRRGVRVAMSIDGTKKSGQTVCNIPIPAGLFERELSVDVGRSMLRRFQMNGRSLETEVVADRLLLTF